MLSLACLQSAHASWGKSKEVGSNKLQLPCDLAGICRYSAWVLRGSEYLHASYRILCVNLEATAPHLQMIKASLKRRAFCQGCTSALPTVDPPPRPQRNSGSRFEACVADCAARAPRSECARKLARWGGGGRGGHVTSCNPPKQSPKYCGRRSSLLLDSARPLRAALGRLRPQQAGGLAEAVRHHAVAKRLVVEWL